MKHAVCQIYFSYFGWLTGDPTTLDPVPSAERAKRYVALMGGRQHVVSEAQRALNATDHRWAADILTYVIRANTADMEARRQKAEALRQLGFQQTSANVHQTMAFNLSDSGQTYGVEIRRGIAQFHPQAPQRVDMTLTTTKPVLDRLFVHEITVGKAVSDGQATVTGDRAAADAFFGYFESPTPRSDIKLTVR